MPNPVRRRAAAASEFDAASFEQQIGHPLPAEYRAFLLESNGGVPKRRAGRYHLPSGKSRAFRVTALAPLTAHGWAEAACPPLPELFALDGNELFDGTLAVGVAETEVNHGTIRVTLAGEQAGRVLFKPAGTKVPSVYPVADSWGEFLESLKVGEPRPKGYDDPIEDGDADLLRKWMKQYPRKWDHLDLRIKAVEENQPQILEMLVAEFDFDAPSIVADALDRHRLDIALRFIPKAAKNLDALADALNRPGPFFWHAPILVEALLSAGADASAEDSAGVTPLHHAARAGAAEAVKLLLAKGADPALAADDGTTPLTLAERGEHRDVANILREALADRPADSDDGVRPFDLCGVEFARTGKPITLDAIREVESKLKLRFPPEYRWLLLQANGAIFRAGGLLPPSVLPELYHRDDEDEDDGDGDEPDDGGAVEVRLNLFPLREIDCRHEEGRLLVEDDDAATLTESAENAKGWYHDGSEIPRWALPIGALKWYRFENGYLLLACRGPKAGQLFAFGHNEEPLNTALPELFAKLAEAGSRPRSPSELLADAVEARDLAAVRAALAAGANIEGTRDGRFTLRMACEAKFDAAVLAMAEHGDVNRVIEEAIQHGSPAVARQLFDAAPKLKRETLETLVHAEAVHADVAFLKAVVARGVKLEKLFGHKHNVSPVAVAAASGSVESLKFLIEKGGRLDRVGDEDGRTVLHEMARSPSKADLRPMVRFLLDNGVPLNAGDSCGHTALHDAILCDNSDAARALIDAGASMAHRAARNCPAMNTPQMQKLMGSAEREMEKLARQLERDAAKEFADEDVPELDPDDPANKDMIEMMALGAKMQDAMRAMLPKLEAKMAEGADDLGPPASGLAKVRPYPHIAPLVAELVEYERALKAEEA